jgi:hypothetical protein
MAYNESESIESVEENFFNSIDLAIEYLKSIIPPNYFKCIKVVTNVVVLAGVPCTVRYINVYRDDSTYESHAVWTHIPRGFFEVQDENGN